MSTPTRTAGTISEAIAEARTAQEKQRQELSRCAGSFAARALIGTVAIAPAIWMGLVWGLVQWHHHPVTFAHIVWVGFAAMLAPMAMMLALSCLDRRDQERRHGELLLALNVLSDRTLSSAEAVDRTVGHLASALPGATKVTQIR
ncbi:hypothetical protein ACQSSU_12980 [Micromonospora echinospora]